MQNKTWSMSGMNAFITGGTSGMGKAIAEAYLQQGASVYITARSAKDIDGLLQQWQAQGYVAYGSACDVSQAQSRENCVAEIKQVFTQLDVLVNNVGPNFKKHIFDFSLAEYQTLIDANMTSTFHLTQLCYPLLQASALASIINISAISSALAFVGSGPYGMAKSAVESFTRTLAIELGVEGIRANAISPGFTATETFMQKYDSAYIDKASQQIPLRRMAKATDIANLACFLAMPASAYVNGQCIVIDGGFSCFGFSGANTT